MTAEKYVWDLSDGDATMKSLLGGKGAGVAEMSRIGIRVPDGFTVTTAACVLAAGGGEVGWPDGLWDQIATALAGLEERTGRQLGAASRPLLVSVRSGAVVSMPGMMDTILNVGIGDASVAAMGAESGDPRFAWDSYRRFLSMYGSVVQGVPQVEFDELLAASKTAVGAASDAELAAADLQDLVAQFKALIARRAGAAPPQDPMEQLRGAIDAVFRSWLNPRARVYRHANNIPDDLGTAVNVMQMVFGNRGAGSATGVCFTRNPSTGAKELYGEFLVNAQGEDVVAGIRTPRPLREMKTLMPQAFSELQHTMQLLELHYRDMQDLEFTVEEGMLYLLQTRSGKRTAQAAVKIAVDLVADGVLDRADALRSIDPGQLDQLLHPSLAPGHGRKPLTRGLNASPGAAVGAVVFDADSAQRRGREGEAVVLVRWETNPDDIHGVIAAQGVLTAHGGMTSHAAVVARGMGKPCVVGAGDLRIDLAARTCAVNGVTLSEGALITLDGTSGDVFAGQLDLMPALVNDDFLRMVGWADEIRRLEVRANADTADDARAARELGAQGIGLCRTEHMFLDEARLPVVRRMIMAEDSKSRAAALSEILPMQQRDFEEIFTAMDGLPVTIRLLDPPLHEFLPAVLDQALVVEDLKRRNGNPAELAAATDLLARTSRLAEVNPMLGTRGVRLALLYPEIPRMQVQAIARAALAVAARGGDPRVEVMVPLVAYATEFVRMRRLVDEVMAAEFGAAGAAVEYSVGTMIELPRAALCADQIAAEADFFSFGTNDLTQTTIGISRDDAEGSFLVSYLQERIVPDNPFATIDQDGVGALVAIGTEKGRATKAGLKVGVCGEHGGDPASIQLFDRLHLDYVSCSPFRVPIARFAAARAILDRTESEPLPGR